jgi:hypothetical protein
MMFDPNDEICSDAYLSRQQTSDALTERGSESLKQRSTHLRPVVADFLFKNSDIAAQQLGPGGPDCAS